MERICSHCHAQLSLETEADWCPACGGALLERERQPESAPKESATPEPLLDHRGIVMPRRHPLGGIITPQ